MYARENDDNYGRPLRSGRAAILADGGGGFLYSVTSSRRGLFCAAFDCSNNKNVQKVRDFFRFPKENIYFRSWLFINKIR